MYSTLPVTGISILPLALLGLIATIVGFIMNRIGR